jgi:hypothetical protein
MKNNKKQNKPIGFDLSELNIENPTPLLTKLLMLIEGTYSIGIKESAKKYKYSEQGYFKLKRKFMEFGIDGLVNQKTGPKTNSKRTDVVEKQILRLRFLNPNDSAAVIAQKLNQQGIKISVRSVERTITSYGIQKKTSIN